MNSSLTSGQKNALAHLTLIRFNAKKAVQLKKIINTSILLWEQMVDLSIRTGDLKAEAINRIDLEACREKRLENKFDIIELGKAFVHVCHLCEVEKLPREVWLRALSVNESEWDSFEMREYGQSISHVVQVLNLENSATKDDSIVSKPLNWCSTMAMMNATKTNPAMGKVMHDACNEVLGGVFGDWKEPSILQRLGAAQ